MSTKFMNFLTMSWFISLLICLILQGTYFSTADNNVINDLSIMTTLKVGGLIPIPAFNLYFFRGIFRILVWDYSFYEGGYAVIRYFWLVVLSPGAVWGISQVFALVFANLMRIFR